MSKKNMAKEWQKGWYQIHVDGNKVSVRTKRNGKVYECYADDHPDDEFNLSEGVKIAMERLEDVINPDVIRVGDKVRIKDFTKIYTCYKEWVISNVVNVDDIAKWQYHGKSNSVERYHNAYNVKYIEAWEKGSFNKLAFIENISCGVCYLYDLNALEKING